MLNRARVLPVLAIVPILVLGPGFAFGPFAGAALAQQDLTGQSGDGAPAAAEEENAAAVPGADRDADARSQQAAPYEDRLMRLAEVTGSVHYLRNLCREEEESGWRASIEALIGAETEDGSRRRRQMIAAFNRGYRSFAAVYTECTAAAVAAERRYRREGATLAGEIVARYGN